jgi:K+-transporting ATPase ATPase A chain
MNIYSWIQILLYIVILLALAKPLGSFMAKIYQGERTFLDRVLGPVERFIYRVSGVNPDDDMNWKTYAIAVMLFNVIGLLFVYLLQRLQGSLPFNPQGLGAVTPDSSWNTAVSFATNTNWQGYGGETTMSYLSQMLGLIAQNFVSAATGMAVLVALIRGIVRTPLSSPHFQNSKMGGQTGVGNFWVDLTRSTLYILLPLSLVVALALVSQGVVQTFSPYKTVALLQPTTDANGNVVTEQVLAVGPAASQIAIKQLGTNGGGFFNVNSAHPFENSTPFSNFIEMLSILVIPAALCYTFGKMVGDTRQGWALLTVMTIIFVALLGLAVWSEQGGNPAFTAMGVDQTQTDINPGGNMEGKETRFGIANSALWATVTTAASNGSVNSMHDSFMPLGGLVPLFMMQLGEIIFGGVGSGLYGMLAFVIVAVFISGLMVGRTPEYLGKKIEAFEMKMASLMLLIPILLAKVGTAIAVVNPLGLATIWNTGGPHGFRLCSKIS